MSLSELDRIPHDRGADAAAYALGALDACEAEAFRRHLLACARCHEEVAAFWRVADVLPLAVPEFPAPAGLRGRLRRAVRARPGD